MNVHITLSNSNFWLGKWFNQIQPNPTNVILPSFFHQDAVSIGWCKWPTFKQSSQGKKLFKTHHGWIGTYWFNHPTLLQDPLVPIAITHLSHFTAFFNYLDFIISNLCRFFFSESFPRKKKKKLQTQLLLVLWRGRWPRPPPSNFFILCNLPP